MADLPAENPSVYESTNLEPAIDDDAQIDNAVLDTGGGLIADAEGETEPHGNPAVSQETTTEAVAASSSLAMFSSSGEEIAGAETEARIPTKKDVTLREFLGKMDDNAPIIPDAVTNYYLSLAGLPPPPQTPPHLARLLALATQKFVADIAADAYQYARIRSSNTTSNTAAAMASMPGAGVTGGMGNVAGGSSGTGVGQGKEGEKTGGIGAKQGMNLGVQRPGFGGSTQGGSQGRTVLTMEDLGMAVGEYGVNVKRGEFYR